MYEILDFKIKIGFDEDMLKKESDMYENITKYIEDALSVLSLDVYDVQEC